MPQPQMGTEGDVLGGRIAAYIIDNILASIIAGVVFGMFFGLAAVADVGALALIGFLFAPIAYLVYFVYLEAGNGQTPGKGVMGIMVVTENGEPIGMSESAIRNVVKVLLDGNIIGLIAIVLTDKSQRVGDILASTVVVEAQ